MIDLKELADLLDAHDLTRIEFEQDDTRIVLERQKQISVTQPAYPPAYPFALQEAQAPAPSVESAKTTTEIPAKAPAGVEVTAPLIGAVYASPEQNAAPFVVLGQQVEKNDTLCLIEAMKTFNEIPAPASGKILSIDFKDGALVEFGQRLFTIG